LVAFGFPGLVDWVDWVGLVDSVGLDVFVGSLEVDGALDVVGSSVADLVGALEAVGWSDVLACAVADAVGVALESALT
jgi:hypothetical protein